MGSYVLEKEKKTEIVEECDVLVAGGGIAGIAAAIAAARNGARVTLVEREYALGGLATLGLITIFLPLCDGKGTQVVYGIGEELLRLSIKQGAEYDYPKAWLEGGTLKERQQKRFVTQFNPIIFALEAEKLLNGLGVRIMYGTLVCGVNLDGNRITAVITENKSGRNAVAAKSIIDCTGDSDICKFSGAKTELYLPKNALASWYYFYANGEVRLKMFGLADVVPEKGRITTNKLEIISDSQRYSGVDEEELSAMVIDGHQRMFDDIIDNRKKDDTYIPVSMSTIPLVRMTRRISGAYTLCDMEDHRRFDDSIGMTGDWRKRGPVYEIPFRILYGHEVKNLITAGRNISVTDGMWDITRVIPSSAVTGQAAGTAAAMCDDFAQIEITELQSRLENANVKLHL